MASRLQDVIMRGLASAKPLATTVAPGTLYHSSDSGVTERSNGTIWESYGAGGGGGGGGITELTGDVLAGPGSGSVVATIPSGSITAADIADGVITTPKINDNAITKGKIQTIATDKLLGRDTPTTGIVEEIGVTGGIEFDGSLNLRLNTNARVKTIVLPFDGGGVVPATGAGRPIRVPFSGNIVKASIFGSTPGGSAIIDVWRVNYAGYPPTVANTITGGTPPTLSSANKNEDSTLTGWSPAISAGDFIQGNLNSVSTHTWVIAVLDVLVN